MKALSLLTGFLCGLAAGVVLVSAAVNSSWPAALISTGLTLLAVVLLHPLRRKRR